MSRMIEFWSSQPPEIRAALIAAVVSLDGHNRHHATLDRVAHHRICRLRDATWHVRSAARSPGEILFESSGPRS